jgi:hypothetical protein
VLEAAANRLVDIRRKLASTGPVARFGEDILVEA